MPEKTLSRAELTADWLSRPSSREWVSGRVVTLLSHYFVAQTDAAVAEKAAEDWIEMLCPMPEWALIKACRSYLAGPDRRRKPLPGDILTLAYSELGFVRRANRRIAEIRARQFLLEQSPELTKEEAKARKKMMAGKFEALIEDLRSKLPETNITVSDVAETVESLNMTPSSSLTNSRLVKRAALDD